MGSVSGVEERKQKAHEGAFWSNPYKLANVRQKVFLVGLVFNWVRHQSHNAIIAHGLSYANSINIPVYAI